MHCHAGCSFDAITAAMGVNPGDLFPVKPEQDQGKPPRIVATYDYTTAAGTLLFQVCRYEPKGFRQRRPDGTGGWIWNLEGVERVLYCLPKVLEAKARGRAVYIVEGEKDVAALEGLGLCATCNSGGAGKWADSYTEALAGADVVIVPDRDEPGRKHAAVVSQALTGRAASVRVVDLPDRDGRRVKDAADWTAAGGTPAELATLVERAAVPAVPAAPQTFNRLISLAALPDPIPETNNPAALFKNGWLRKGGGAFLVAPSGQGKSSWTIQAAILWAMGKPAFGIEPLRPLKIAIIQAEDDGEEMSDFRNQIVEGLAAETGIARTSIIDAMLQGVFLFDMVGQTGQKFVDRVGDMLNENPFIDLLIVNPFQSYFGGDVSRNVELTAFLRGGLDPVIKPNRVGILFAHHTNKPPNAKDRSNWGLDAFSAYIGAGGAEIVNWARAMLALMPVENTPGLFRFVAGKRGQRLGWTDDAGLKTRKRLIAHHDRLIYWRAATEAEVDAATNEGGKCVKEKGDPVKDAIELALKVKVKPMRKTELWNCAELLWGRVRGRKAVDYLQENPGEFSLAIVKAKRNGAIFVGTHPEVEAAVLEWDSPKQGRLM
jgi:5S rRNA maturation endonuclease (ribonuclease M5)